jgi:hypothetical protein
MAAGQMIAEVSSGQADLVGFDSHVWFWRASLMVTPLQKYVRQSDYARRDYNGILIALDADLQ